MVWGQWRASVVKHGLGGEKLGRFAPTLRNMTRVIWNTPLEAYTQFNLGEIRSMKTHGEKRVRAILEVFHSVHVLVANMGTQDHLVVRIFPRLIDQVEQWIGHALQTPGVPTTQELFEHVVSPLLEQVRTDATQQIASLAENRLGISGPITSVRQAARAMGLTRARVYQLLNEINDIMAVRWPNGRHQMYELREKLVSRSRSRWTLRPTCSSSSPPSSCSIPAVAAAPPARWNTILDDEEDEEEERRDMETSSTWSAGRREGVSNAVRFGSPGRKPGLRASPVEGYAAAFCRAARAWLLTSDQISVATWAAACGRARRRMPWAMIARPSASLRMRPSNSAR